MIQHLVLETSGTETCFSLSGEAPPEVSLPQPVIQYFLIALSISMAGVVPSGIQTRPTALFNTAGFSSVFKRNVVTVPQRTVV